MAANYLPYDPQQMMMLSAEARLTSKSGAAQRGKSRTSQLSEEIDR